MPHLNELHERKGPKGLTIVALTSSVSDAFMKKHGIRYAVGVGGPSASVYGVTGIPQVYLIGADGKVVWQGHTAGLTEALIDAELAKIVRFPDRAKWPQAVAGAARLARQGKLGKAFKALERVRADGDEATREAAQALRDYIERTAAQWESEAQTWERSGAYLEAKRIYERMGKRLHGHPAAERARARLRALLKDHAIRNQIEAAKLFEQGRAFEQRHEFKRAIAAYVRAAKRGGDTPIGRRARARAVALANEQR